MVTVLAMLVMTPAAALGHGSLTGAEPAPGERLADPPRRVVLAFSEPLNRRLSDARLLDAASGRTVATVRTVHARRVTLTPRSPLVRGTYVVHWRTVSTVDAHPLEGSYGFGVRAAAAAPRSVQDSPLARGGWLRGPARGLLYAAALVFAGALFAGALLGRGWLTPAQLRTRSPAANLDAVSSRGRSLLADSGVLALGLAALVCVIEAFSAAGRVTPGALADFLLTGTAGPARLGMVAALGVALALARSRPRAAALAAALALACVSATSHAGSASPRAGALAADYVHLLAGAAWLGPSALALGAWWPSLRAAGALGRREIAASLLPRLGSLAVPAFAVAVATGTISAAIELGRLSALWQTPYGRVLTVKVALVAIVVLVAYLHGRRLAPRLAAANPHPGARVDRAHWLLLGSEPWLGAAIVMTAGVLVAFPLPPRQLDEATGRALADLPCSPCPVPAPAARELAVAGLAGSQVAAAYVRREGGGLRGRLRLIDRRGQAAVGPASVAGASMSPCGRGCFDFALSSAPAQLAVRATERGRTWWLSLPARWVPGREPAARALLTRAESVMRGLDGLREVERVTSGPGTLAVTRYRLRAPDRLAFVTDRGVGAVQIGRRRWLRLPGGPWRRRDEGSAVAFSTRSWFAFTPYARSVRLLDVRRERGRAVWQLALADPGTPVWTRLWIDQASGRVLRERLTARARQVERTFSTAGPPVVVRPPTRVAP